MSRRQRSELCHRNFEGGHQRTANLVVISVASAEHLESLQYLAVSLVDKASAQADIWKDD